MDLAFAETSSLLRDSVREFLSARYADDVRKQVAAAPDYYPGTQLWRDLARELDLLRLGFPESCGGFGATRRDVALVMEEFGRVASFEPFIEGAIVASGFLSRCHTEQAIRIREPVMSGAALIAWAHEEAGRSPAANELRTTVFARGGQLFLTGHKSSVPGGAWATHFIVTARVDASASSRMDAATTAIWLLERATPGVSRRTFKTQDGRFAAELTFGSAPLSEAAQLKGSVDSTELLETVLDEACAAACSEGAGLMSEILAMTQEYLSQRRQFGKPLAQQQSLQHRLVDMYLHIEQATSLARMAAYRMEQGSARQASRHVSAAKAFLGRAARFVYQNAIQLHGAIGTTEELALNRYCKRLMLICNQYGSTWQHLRRFAALSAETSHATDQ